MAALEPTWRVTDIRALAERLAPGCVTASHPTGRYQGQWQQTPVNLPAKESALPRCLAVSNAIALGSGPRP